MPLIRTARKEKLPKGFSYPLGTAEAISAALDGIPQFDNAEIWFNWRAEFWVSRWRKRLQSRGVVALLRVAYADYFGKWHLTLYSVPSEYSMAAREHLHVELLRVHDEMLAARPTSKLYRTSVWLSLSEAEKAANKARRAASAAPGS